MNIRKWVAGVSAAGLLGGGAVALAATSASAATMPAATMSAVKPLPAAQQWQLNGRNEVVLTFNGNTYTYHVQFRTQIVREHGGKVELLTGTLRDTYEPSAISLPITGVINGNHVTFSVSYPRYGVDAGNQGVRTFSGTIRNFGHVSGNWSETGSEGGSGTWYLTAPAVR